MQAHTHAASLLQIRTIIAKRLLESKHSIPHAYFTAEVQLDEVGSLREALKQSGSKVVHACHGCEKDTLSPIHHARGIRRGASCHHSISTLSRSD